MVEKLNTVIDANGVELFIPDVDGPLLPNLPPEGSYPRFAQVAGLSQGSRFDALKAFGLEDDFGGRLEYDDAYHPYPSADASQVYLGEDTEGEEVKGEPWRGGGKNKDLHPMAQYAKQNAAAGINNLGSLKLRIIDNIISWNEVSEDNVTGVNQAAKDALWAVLEHEAPGFLKTKAAKFAEIKDTPQADNYAHYQRAAEDFKVYETSLESGVPTQALVLPYAQELLDHLQKVYLPFASMNEALHPHMRREKMDKVKGTFLDQVLNRALGTYLTYFSPPRYGINLFDTFADLCHEYMIKDALASGQSGPLHSFESFLGAYSGIRADLAPYPGYIYGSTETRTLMEHFLRERGITVDFNSRRPDRESQGQLALSTGGFKGIYQSAVAAIMPNEGQIALVPKGFYQSLCFSNLVSKGTLKVIEKMDGACVRAALEQGGVKVLNITNVSNPDGHVMDAETCRDIAQAVYEYNIQRDKKDWAYVISDEVYNDTTFDNGKTPSIGAVYVDDAQKTFHDLGMCITVLSASKTYGDATDKIGVVACGDTNMVTNITRKDKALFSGYQIPFTAEVSAAASIVFLENEEIHRNNEYYKARSQHAKARIAEITAALGVTSLVTTNDPEGGWYIDLIVDRAALYQANHEIPIDFRSDAMHRWLIYHDAEYVRDNNGDTGRIVLDKTSITGLPGSITGYENVYVEDDGKIHLRLSIASGDVDTICDHAVSGVLKLVQATTTRDVMQKAMACAEPTTVREAWFTIHQPPVAHMSKQRA